MDWLLDIYHAFRLPHAVWCYIAYGLVALGLFSDGWKVTAAVVVAVGWVVAGAEFTGGDKAMTFGAWITNFGVIILLLFSTLPCYIPFGVWSAWEWWKEWSSRHTPGQLQEYAKTLGGVTVPHERGAVALLPCGEATVAVVLECNGIHTWASVYLPWKGEPPVFVTTEGKLAAMADVVMWSAEVRRVESKVIAFDGDVVDRVEVGLGTTCAKLLAGAAIALPLVEKHPGLEPVALAEIAPFLISKD